MEEEFQQHLYSEFIGEQNELILDKDNFSFEKYLASCANQVPITRLNKVLLSKGHVELDEGEIAGKILVQRDPVPKLELDEEMKELLKSDVKENLKIISEVKNQIVQ